MLSSEDLSARIEKIRAFTFDIDGVFTNGGILCDLQGELYRTFDSKDGFSIRMAVMNGYPVGIITGGRSESIRQRFLSSAVPSEDIFLGSRDKTEAFGDFCSRHSLSPEEVLYMGDDIPDLDLIRLSGIGACPSDAIEEILQEADFVSSKPGGHGSVREVVEMVMKAQGRWNFDVATYKRLY